jgi:phosphatidate cytidylyltransferase
VLTDPALLPTFLILLFSILGALTLATLVGLILKQRVAHGQPHGVIDNLNSRNKAWWVMVAVGTLAFLAGSAGVCILFALLSFTALREYLTLAGRRSGDHAVLALVFYAVLPLQYLFVWLQWEWLSLLFIPVGVLALLPLLMLAHGAGDAYLQNVAKIQWGTMVCVYGLSHVPALFMLRIEGYESHNVLLAIFFVLVVQLGDVLQFIWGKLFGRHLIAPVLSPSKTVEGMLGGILSAALIGMGMQAITPFGRWEAGLIALGLCVMGFLGGLVMSAIKRDGSAKNWGQLIPGHGGVLDRVDSIVLSAPLFYHLVRWGWTTPS